MPASTTRESPHKSSSTLLTFTRGCYCGREFDGTRTRVVPEEECSIRCPGNSDEFCGGNLLLRKGLGRRMSRAISNSILLTMYRSIDIVPPPPVTTVTTTVKPHPSHVVCHDNGRCDPVVIVLEPHRGDDCFGEIVYEKPPCVYCETEPDWEPTLCIGDRCKGKIVYKPRECSRDCEKEIIVIEKPCHACEGGVIYIDQVIVVPPVTIHRNHTKTRTKTRHHSHSRTVTVTTSLSTDVTTYTTTSSTTVTSTEISTVTSTVAPSTTSSTTPSSTVTPSTATTPAVTTTVTPPTSTATSTETSSFSSRGDPRNRVIDGPTETTEAVATQTSPPATETSHVAAGAGKTAASILSAVIAAFLFM